MSAWLTYSIRILWIRVLISKVSLDVSQERAQIPPPSPSSSSPSLTHSPDQPKMAKIPPCYEDPLIFKGRQTRSIENVRSLFSLFSLSLSVD